MTCKTVTSILFRAVHCYLTITAVRAFLLSAQYQASQFLITEAYDSALCLWSTKNRGGARHFHLGGPLEGPVLQQGELSMVWKGLSERDLKNFGGARQNLGWAVALPGTPVAPPLTKNTLTVLCSFKHFCFCWLKLPELELRLCEKLWVAAPAQFHPWGYLIYYKIYVIYAVSILTQHFSWPGPAATSVFLCPFSPVTVILSTC